MRRPLARLGALFLVSLQAIGCGDPEAAGPKPTIAAMSFSADLAEQSTFYDFPYPSDLRLTAEGTPDLRGIPFPSFITLFNGLRDVAQQHPGFPVVPVAYFKMSAPIMPL